MMTFLLFLAAAFNGYVAYTTGSAFSAFMSGITLGLGIGSVFVGLYQGIINEMLK